MVDTHNLRSKSPAPTPKRKEGSRRANSAPAESRRPKGWFLESVLLTPRKRKLPSAFGKAAHNAAAPDASYPSAAAASSSKIKLPSSTELKPQPGKVRKLSPTKPPKRKRPASVFLDTQRKKPTRRAQDIVSNSRSSDVHEKGLFTPAPSASEIARPKRTIKSRSKVIIDKGKGKVVETEEADTHEADDISTRPTKRRRLSPSLPHEWEKTSPVAGPSRQIQLTTPPPTQELLDHVSETDYEIDGDGQDIEETTSNLDFQMLDFPEMVSLPWVSPSDDHQDASIYIPAGIALLMKNMKSTIELESAARRKAEERLAQEMQGRIDAERSAKRLEEENAILLDEKRRLQEANQALQDSQKAWMSAAAATLATTVAADIQSAIEGSRTDESTPITTPVDENEESQAVEDSLSSRALAIVDVKGKGRMSEHVLSTFETSDVLQRAAAVQEMLNRFLPLEKPGPTSVQPCS